MYTREQVVYSLRALTEWNMRTDSSPVTKEMLLLLFYLFIYLFIHSFI